MLQAVAAVRDATMKAVDMAVEEAMNRRTVNGEWDARLSSSSSSLLTTRRQNRWVASDALSPSVNVDAQELIDEAFYPLEQSLPGYGRCVVNESSCSRPPLSGRRRVVQVHCPDGWCRDAAAAAEEAASEKGHGGYLCAAAESGVNVTV
jgi:hypothetical protein